MKEDTFHYRDWKVGDKVYLICETYMTAGICNYTVEEGYVERVTKEFGYPDPEHPIYTHSINVRHGNRLVSHLYCDRDINFTYLNEKLAMAAAKRLSKKQEPEIRRVIDLMTRTLDSIEQIKFTKYENKSRR